MAKFGNKARLLTMMAFTGIFFMAEIITGYLTNSMALVADSFHMLSDVLSIVIAYLAVHYSGKKSKRNTYNWARAEVLGAMANAVFLLALVFTIVVSAIQRLITVEPITQPLIILGVGGAGLVINIIGLFIFGGHAHGHSHSHGHNHSHEQHALSNEHSHHQKDNPGDANQTEREISATAGSQMNMHAVFLHVMGDALGSVVVILSALVIYFVKEDWRYYVDPVMSLVISVIISLTTIPLLRNASMILLQNPPSNMDVDKMKDEVTQVSGIASIHDLHVWQLSNDCVIATVHVILQDDYKFTDVAQKLKKIFHANGIHSTTIQPEFSTPERADPAKLDHISLNGGEPQPCSSSSDSTMTTANSESDTECLLRCISNDCTSKMCCTRFKQKRISEGQINNINKCYDNPGYVGPTSNGNGGHAAVIEIADASDMSTVA